MATIPLIFEGPFSYKCFLENHPKNADFPGVYFWGFKNFQFSTERIQEPAFDNKGELDMTVDQMMSQLPFFPYYVGIHQRNVFSRIKGHYEKIRSINNTYTIFEKIVYPSLPKYLQKVTRSGHPNTSALEEFILYCNDKEFFRKKYNLIQNKGSTSANIDALNGNNNIRNTIEQVYTPENLMVCFARFLPINNGESIPSNNKLTEEDKLHLRNIEAAVKFCLRINTIGFSKNIDIFDSISISFKQDPSIIENPYLDRYLFFQQKERKIEYDAKNSKYFALIL